VINTSYARFVEDWMAKEPWYSVFSGALSSTYLLVCWSGLYFGIKSAPWLSVHFPAHFLVLTTYEINKL
jgi:hypothetical protein